jgi:uncharacterized protein (DUF433 family)
MQPSSRCNCGSPRDSRSYDDLVMYERITVEANKMAGQPCIRGLRIPVATVVAMVADGMTNEEILHEHPDLEAEDIAEALRYAAEAVRERELPLRQPA